MSHGDAQTEAAFGTDPARDELDHEYAVKLPIFEGPLDLLLHLIRQNEVDIKDIPVSLIGEQYLDYIELMRDLNIDVAAEYLVMAATLALIKSRMLLPAEDADGEEDALDPRAELVARLLEYQRFKEVAHSLSEKRWLDRDIYRIGAPGVSRPKEAEREIEVGLFDLIEAFRTVLDEWGNASLVHSVEGEPITVRDRMLFVMEVLAGRSHIEFAEVFRTEGPGPPSRSILIATFLAILELARLEALSLFQGVDGDGAPEGPIRLRPESGEGSETPDWRSRIAETM